MKSLTYFAFSIPWCLVIAYFAWRRLVAGRQTASLRNMPEVLLDPYALVGLRADASEAARLAIFSLVVTDVLRAVRGRIETGSQSPLPTTVRNLEHMELNLALGIAGGTVHEPEALVKAVSKQTDAYRALQEHIAARFAPSIEDVIFAVGWSAVAAALPFWLYLVTYSAGSRINYLVQLIPTILMLIGVTVFAFSRVGLPHEALLNEAKRHAGGRPNWATLPLPILQIYIALYGFGVLPLSVFPWVAEIFPQYFGSGGPTGGSGNSDTWTVEVNLDFDLSFFTD